MKLCGCKEPCFVKGEVWGHLEGIICAHQTETETDRICDKTKEVVTTYYTLAVYNTLKQ